MKTSKGAARIRGRHSPEFKSQSATKIPIVPGVFNVFGREIDPVAIDVIAHSSSHSGLKEALHPRVSCDIMHLIELASLTRGKNQGHAMFRSSRRREEERVHIHMFDFVGDFAHGWQGDFRHNLASDIVGRSG
jgi:hypothetical protein